ncbi:MAG: family 10 glycosylhydrolase [Verrucomicrobiota bacterium]
MFRLIACLTALLLSSTQAQYKKVRERVPEPVREFRGAWIATVHNIDWPSKPGLSASRQKAELIAILDHARSLHLNAIILQVRPACDALYASSREPWSPFLTGRMGRPPSPYYDPLSFAVFAAHERGLELHAWFNPFRALASSRTKVSPNHVTRTHPAAIRAFQNQRWLDPGDPWVHDHSIGVIIDVVQRYDIDGVHIDDYFYPYPIRKNGVKLDIPFRDGSTFARHGKGMKRDEWRRRNINTFIQRLYRGIKSQKPHVKFGVSPFGIWRPQQPPGIEAQLDAYAEIYADSRKWFREGTLDYFTPQLYWRIDPPAQSFGSLVGWWAKQNQSGRHLWPGIATSRINSTVDPGRPASEILNQIALTRKTLGRFGHGHSHCHRFRRPRHRDR